MSVPVPPPLAKRPPRKARPQRTKSLKRIAPAAGPEARKRAAAILEVLGGARTTTDAAQAIGVTLPRYYHLEARALEGLLAACEPGKPGRGPNPTRELEALRKRCVRLEREVGRQQALVRAAHRLAGVGPVVPMKSRPGKKRPRRPTARALVAAVVLRSSEPAATPPSTPGSP
jgi:hypothetical protein